MATPAAKSFELTFAYHLLRFLGGNTSNTYLLLAIVAWVRRESGSTYLGNNPLNLRPGTDDYRTRLGMRKGAVGYYSTYRSLYEGARATAIRIKGISTAIGFNPALAALRRRMPTMSSSKQTAWMQDQALDFMYGVALSKWNADHYGYGRTPNPMITPAELFSRNQLVPLWQKMLGYAVTMPGQKPPAQPPAPKPPPPPPPVPSQPRSFINAVPVREYLDPYAAYKSYEARRQEQGPVPSPAIDPEW